MQRFFVEQAYQNARESNNNLAACALCILDCLLGILENLVQYLNRYAFAICAIYGKPFLQAANQAWALMKSRGFDAIINDSLINGVMSLIIIIGGLSTGIFGALVGYYGYNTDWRVWAGLGFLIGAALMFVIAEIVDSSVTTLFICLADDPATLQRTKPEEYNRITQSINKACQTKHTDTKGTEAIASESTKARENATRSHAHDHCCSSC